MVTQLKPQVTDREPALKWRDEAGMPRATNEAWRIHSVGTHIASMLSETPRAKLDAAMAETDKQTFKAGTIVHCNRCDKTFPLSRDRQGYPFDKGSAATRLTEFERCPHCETRDTHYVYARDNAAPEPPAVLVPATQVVRRKAYFLRMCQCGHAGRANFHNGDESVAFELIASKTWRCGWCLSNQPNPGKDDAEYTAATKPAPKRHADALPLGVNWTRADEARYRDGIEED